MIRTMEILCEGVGALSILCVFGAMLGAAYAWLREAYFPQKVRRQQIPEVDPADRYSVRDWQRGCAQSMKRSRARRPA